MATFDQFIFRRAIREGGWLGCLTESQKDVLWVLLDRADNDDGTSFASIPTIAREAVMSSRTVSRAILSLMNLGIVETFTVTNEKDQKKRTYRKLLIPGTAPKIRSRKGGWAKKCRGVRAKAVPTDAAGENMPLTDSVMAPPTDSVMAPLTDSVYITTQVTNQITNQLPPAPPAGVEPLSLTTSALRVGPDGFRRFWKLWPRGRRKIGKAKCLAKWESMKLEAITDRVVATLKMFLRSDQWKKDGGQFIPKPISWLRDAPWETDLVDLRSPPTPDPDAPIIPFRTPDDLERLGKIMGEANLAGEEWRQRQVDMIAGRIPFPKVRESAAKPRSNLTERLLAKARESCGPEESRPEE